MKVAMLGGTGAFGSALARRLVEAGIEVTIGSRDPDRAAATAAEVGARGRRERGGRAGVDLVVLSVDASAAVSTRPSSRRDRRDAGPERREPAPLRERRRASRRRPVSLAERVQQLLRGPVVAGLHSLAARSLAAGKADGDALVCGDDETAKAAALELAATLVTGRALDAGPLASARALEGMTAVIVNLNRRYRGHAGLRIVGL